MELRITTLSENTTGSVNLLGEWGLSTLIEADEANVLFDTGQSISANHNTDILGIDLKKIDKIVLSHGHYDHTGGLRQILLKMKRRVEVIAHPDIWSAKYRRRQNEADRYIGIPFSRPELESLGANFRLTAKPVKITENVMTTGEIPMITDFEEIDPNLFVSEDGILQPDKLLDDQSIIINTKLGLVVVLGCAHRGMINTLYHAQKLTGVKLIYAVLGGSHLITASEERTCLTIAALKDLGVQRLGLSHCTGQARACLLAQEFGDKFFFNSAGTIFSLPEESS